MSADNIHQSVHKHLTIADTYIADLDYHSKLESALKQCLGENKDKRLGWYLITVTTSFACVTQLNIRVRKYFYSTLTLIQHHLPRGLPGYVDGSFRNVQELGSYCLLTLYLHLYNTLTVIEKDMHTEWAYTGYCMYILYM
jgi:hypothetical protein